MKTKNTKVETPRNKKANHKSSIKYVFLIALVVCMVFCLFACGESDTQFVDDGTFTVNLYDGDTVLGSYKTPKNTVVASAPTAEPEKSGYIFDGWFFDKELTAPVVYPLTVSKNSDFYAKFSPSCVITYYGENNQLIKEIAVVRGELAVFPTDEEILAVTPVGSHFAKWNIAKFNTDQKFLTVTAVFEKNEYKINFVIGKDSYHTISAKFGDAIGAMPADPLWGEGEDVAYTFAHWSETADGTPFDFSALNNKMPSHDITLHACWTENRFAVKFFNGDLEMPSLSMTYGASDIKNFKFPTTEKIGFEFAGWFDNKALTGEAVTALAENAVGDKTFWAKFEIKDITIDVKTDAVNNAITFGDNITLSCEHQKLDGFTYSYSWFLGELTAKPSGSVALSTTETLFLLRPTVLDEYRYTVFVEVKSPIAETSAMFATISFSVNAQKIEIADSDLNWSGVYDGNNHGIDTSKIPAKYLEGGTVLYSLDEINFTTTAPEFKDASVAPYQVFFRVENPNFETYDGVSTVTITKKDVSVSYTGLSKNYDGQAFSASLLDGLTVINGLVGGDTVTAGEIATYGINAGQYSTKDFAFTVPFAINGDSEMTNYQVVFEFSASIGKNQLTVSALQSVTYGAELNGWTYSYVGFIDGEDQQLVVGAPNVLGVDYEKGNATGFKNYSIDISQLSAENYVFVDGLATLQIEKAEVKIVGSQSVSYGSALGDWTFEFEGLLFGQSAISLKIEPTVADTNYTTSTSVGVYQNGKIICADTANYTFVDGVATLTVDRKSVDINAVQTVTYGSALSEWTFTYGAFANGDTAISLLLKPTVDTNYTVSTAVGVYQNGKIICADTENYTFVGKIATLNVEKMSVDINAEQTVKYGSALGDWAFTFGAFANGDTEKTLLLKPTVDTDYTVSTSVGVYQNGKITCFDTENYTFVGKIATLTVIKATPQFTAPAGIIATLNMTTDDLSLPLGFSFDSKTAFDTIGEKIVTVTFTPTDTINFEVVTGIEITISVNNDTIDHIVSVTGYNANYTAFDTVDKNALNIIVKWTISKEEKAYVGDFAVNYIARNCFQFGDTKFVVAVGSATKEVAVSVAKMSVSISAKQTITYGSALGDWTFTYGAFASGDTEQTLLLKPTVDTNYTVSTSVGVYTNGKIVCADTANYTFVLGLATLTVNKMSVDVSAVQAVTYGSALGDWTFTYGAFANTDNEQTLSLKPTVENNYTVTTAVGNYIYVISLLDTANYKFVLGTATLTVDKMSVDVSAVQAVTYGSALSDWTFTYGAFANTDTASSLLLNPTVADTNYTVSTNVGEYTYAISLLDTANYTFVLGVATLTVDQKSVSVKAEQTVTYGSALGVWKYVAIGFANEDTLAILGLTPTVFGVNYASGNDAGIYKGAVDVSSFATVSAASNYSFIGGEAVLTVETATPTYTVPTGIRACVDTTSQLIALPSGFSFSQVYTFSPLGSFNAKLTFTPTDTKNYKVVTDIAVVVSVENNFVRSFVVSNVGANYHAFDTASGIVVTATWANGDVNALTGYTVNYQNGGDSFRAGDTSFTVSYGGLTVTQAVSAVAKRDFTISASQQIAYGGSLANWEFVAVGLATGDTLSGLGFAISVAVTDGTKVVGAYSFAISCSGNDNYNFAGGVATLTVVKATPIISANDVVADWVVGGVKFPEAVVSSFVDTATTPLKYFVDGVEMSLANISFIGGKYQVKITVAGTENYFATEKLVAVTVKSAKIGATTYTLEDALSVAVSGNKIIVFGNANLSGANELKTGVTLLLPLDDTGALTADGTAENAYQFYVQNTAKYVYRTVSLLSGAVLNVNGTLQIGGIISYPGQPNFHGHTSGMHSEIKVQTGAKINVYGTVNCYGYILGDGAMEFFSGSNGYSPFVVRDFRGGTSTGGAYKKGNISPFSIYEMPNIQTDMKINYGANYYGYCSLYANSKYNTTEVLIFGKTNALINMNFEKSYVETKYNYVYDSAIEYDYDKTLVNVERYKFVGKTTMKFNGGASVGSLIMTIKVSIVIGEISVDINTADVLFPISYLYDIQLYAGTYTMGFKYKLMPGAKLTVAEGATLNLNSEFIVYTNDNVDAVMTGGCPYPSGKGDAQFIVDGTVNIDGKFGGLVRSAKEGATVVVGAATTLSMTSKEGYGGGNPFKWEFTETASITKTGQLWSADGTATDMAQNKTYTYSPTGVWA